MEALPAIGLASNIVQFADCGIRWASSAIELYKSGNGALQENIELEKVINSLRSVVLGLKTENRLQGDKTLDALVTACLPLADELTVILSKLKVDWQNRSRREILRKALQSLLKKEHIQDIACRLERIRDQIYVHVNFLLVSQQFVLIPSLRELTDVQKSMAADTQADLSSIRSRLEDMCLKLQNVSGWAQDFATEFPSLLQKFCEETRDFNKLRRILKGLYFEQLQMRQSQVKQAHKNTLEWIFAKNSNVNLCSWLRHGGGIYWISGKARSGKSTLMKFLGEHGSTHKLLKEWAGTHSIVTVSHYFWSAGAPMQKSQGGLLRTLLSKILISCPEVAPLICGERWEDDSFDSLNGWTHKELCDVFQSLTSLQQLPVRFFLLIDGLDEYDGDHHELAELLVEISRVSNIKICASSRPWNDFINAFGQSRWKLFIHELTKDDIQLYTEDNLKQNRRFLQLQDREPVAAKSLAQEISERSQGVFLWVYLVVRSLLRGLANRDEIRDLQRRLDELPSSLEDYFELMLSRIENVYRNRTARILRTLLEKDGSLPLIALHFLEMEQDDPDYATGKKIVPCSKDQLNAILEDKEWQLNAQCKDILEVVRTREELVLLGDTFVFLHRTVKDFLRMKRIDDLLRTRSGPDFDPFLAALKIRLAHFKIHPVDDPFAKQNTQLLGGIILFESRRLELCFKRSEIALLDDFWETTSTAKGLLRYDWRIITPTLCCFMCVAAKFGLSLYVTQNFERCSGGEEHQARLLQLSLHPKFMTSIDHLRITTHSRLATVIFLLRKGVSPNLLFTEASTIWANWVMTATSQKNEDGFEDVFEVCRLMISHGADRWMRSKAAVAASGYCNPSNDVMPHLEKVFTIEQFRILSSLYKESSAKAVQEAILVNKRRESVQGWAECSYPSKTGKPEIPGSFNHQGRGQGRGQERRRGHYTGIGGENAPSHGVFSLYPNILSSYPLPAHHQPFGPHSYYQTTQTQASGHFATQVYSAPSSSQWPYPLSPTPSHAYSRHHIQANTQFTGQSNHHESWVPSTGSLFYHDGEFYPNHGVVHTMAFSRPPNYHFQ